jgi:hypothetical protein
MQALTLIVHRLLIGIFLIFAIVLLSFSHSLSTDWAYIGSNDPTHIFDYYVDCDSLIIDGNQITYWSKVESKDIEVKAIYGKTIDCKERKIRDSDVHLYDREGSLLKSDLYGYVGDWREIIPDSVNDVMLIILCNEDNQPKKNIYEHIKTWEDIALKVRERKTDKELKDTE